MNWIPWRKREPVVENYLARNRLRFRPAQDVEESIAIVLDAETTGFDLTRDHLLSLATMEIQRREIRVSSTRQWLFYQPEATLNAAVEVHGILPSESAEGKPEDSVMRELLPVLGNHLIVGHHIGFDAAMLNRATKRHLGVRLKNRVVDTAIFAMRELVPFHKTGYPNQRPPSLDEVCSQLGIEMIDRHTATGDTFTTAQVFLLLCARMRQRLGRPLRIRDLPLVKV